MISFFEMFDPVQVVNRELCTFFRDEMICQTVLYETYPVVLHQVIQECSLRAFLRITTRLKCISERVETSSVLTVGKQDTLSDLKTSFPL